MSCKVTMKSMCLLLMMAASSTPPAQATCWRCLKVCCSSSSSSTCALQGPRETPELVWLDTHDTQAPSLYAVLTGTLFGCSPAHVQATCWTLPSLLPATASASSTPARPRYGSDLLLLQGGAPPGY